jgi:D-galactarolactone cycloisomerase
LLDGLEGLDIVWLEEPLRPGDTDGLAALAERSDIPIAAGENEFTPEAFQDLLGCGSVRIVQPNITRAGGVSGLLAIDRLAQDHGAAVSPHGVGASVGVASLLHSCSALETFTTVEANRLLNPLRDEVGLSFLPGDDGRLRLPDGPGHGGAPDWAMLRRLVDDRLVDALIAGTGGTEPLSKDNAR